MAAVAARYDDLQALGVNVISVSVDSVFTHKMWNDHELSKMVEGGIPWMMASDTPGNVGKVYGVYDEDSGVELRGRFIIDPDGVIQAAEILTPPVGRNIDETIRQVQAFQHVRATGGKEAMPAEWKPGKPTLKPGPDLVGNVWKVWKPGE
ncbi:MAG: redoxin domain-containing protein [Chloroflexi bacterium]|nr:redoxin domain-containing protein [Chloroflexota bacterium]